MKSGWHGERGRHALASKGIKTKDGRSLVLERLEEIEEQKRRLLKTRPTKKELDSIKVGDIIVFRPVTIHSGTPTLKRKVTEIGYNGGIGVRAFGYNPFWVRRNEIMEII